jgi:hypothetical protein
VANDFLTIAAALATKGGAISNVRKATSEVPDDIAETPMLVVYPPNGDVSEPMSQEVVMSTFPATLYLPRPASTARALVSTYPFINSFLVAWRTGRTLGLAGYVQDSWIQSWALDDFADMGDVEYIGVHFLFGVKTRENVSRSA